MQTKPTILHPNAATRAALHMLHLSDSRRQRYAAKHDVASLLQIGAAAVSIGIEAARVATLAEHTAAGRAPGPVHAAVAKAAKRARRFFGFTYP